jgi:hypothetical protein
LPRSISEVEAFMAKASKEMEKYAVKTNPFDNVLKVQIFDAKNLDLGSLNATNFENGITIRSGWIESSKTHEIHSH